MSRLGCCRAPYDERQAQRGFPCARSRSTHTSSYVDRRRNWRTKVGLTTPRFTGLIWRGSVFPPNRTRSLFAVHVSMRTSYYPILERTNVVSSRTDSRRHDSRIRILCHLGFQWTVRMNSRNGDGFDSFKNMFFRNPISRSLLSHARPPPCKYTYVCMRLEN